MIIQINPDKQKAQSLMNIADITLKRLETTDKLAYPSNTLKDYYDIIHSLLEALSLTEGIKIKGEGAHKELIDYICKKQDLPESKRIFLQEMRDYRNRISYEGFNIDKNYISSNEDIIQKIIKFLSKRLKK